MAENLTIAPETNESEEQVEPKTPGKFKTFVGKHRRTLIALAVGAVAGAGGTAAAVKTTSGSSTSSDTVPGEVTSSTDTAMSEA